MENSIKSYVDGIDWCYTKELAPTDILQAKYKKGTRVYIAENQTNGLSKNIKTNSGRVLIGFLSDEAISWVTYQEAIGETVYGVIHKVEGLFPYLTVEVKLSINPINIPKAKQSARSVKLPIRQTKALHPVLKPINSKTKHPITNKAFATKALDKFVEDNRGVCGIYCIYSKEFATYIGQSIDIGGRVRKHIYELKNNKHHNTQMQNDWNDRGAKFFTYHLIESCDFDELDEFEALYIAKYQTYRYGYNRTPDGQGNTEFENEVTITEQNANVIDDQVDEIFSFEDRFQISVATNATNRNFEYTEAIDEEFSETNTNWRENANFDSDSLEFPELVTRNKRLSTLGDLVIQNEYNQILERLNKRFQDEANKLKLSDGAIMLMSKNTLFFTKRKSKVLKPFRLLLLSVQTERKRFGTNIDTSGLLTLQAKLKEYIEYYS